MVGADSGSAVYVGLGSNQGDSEDILRTAVDMLASLPDTRVTRTSALYRTAPIGGPEQPDYLNQVVELETSLSPTRSWATASPSRRHWVGSGP